MLFLRPITTDDLPTLELFASEANAGLTNLPDDKELLRRKITHSLASFEAKIRNPGDELYLFALTDSENGEVYGVSGIFAKTGTSSPQYYYQLESHQRHSETLKRDWEEQILFPIEETDGPSEICALFLHRNHRSGGIGKLLSLARFLFIAAFPERFDDVIMAEMRGVSNDCNDCPFWDAVGYHFINVKFCEAMDLFIRRRNFVPEILPDYPIYVSLLPEAAQKVIGEPHPHTLPAQKMLERQGFRFTGRVDIFDAGPTIAARIQDVSAVKDQHEFVVSKIEESVAGTRAIVSNTSIDFRACLDEVVIDIEDESVVISNAIANILNIGTGERVRILPQESKMEK